MSGRRHHRSMSAVNVWHEFPVPHTIGDWISLRHRTVSLVGGGHYSFNPSLPMLILPEHIENLVLEMLRQPVLADYVRSYSGVIVIYKTTGEPFYNSWSPKFWRWISAIVQYGSLRELDQAMCPRQFQTDWLKLRTSTPASPELMEKNVEDWSLEDFLSGISRINRRHALRRCYACRAQVEMAYSDLKILVRERHAMDHLATIANMMHALESAPDASSPLDELFAHLFEDESSQQGIDQKEQRLN